MLTLSNSSAIDVEFASGDVSLQVPGSVYSAGVRRIVVGAGVRGRDVNATDVVRPFASFVSLQVEPAGAGIGATPLQLCLTTALFNGRLCWAVNDYEERGWFCTNVTTFLKDLKTCARIDALPTDGTPRAFTLLAPADLMPGTSTSRTLPDGRNVTTTNASMTNTTVICVVGNQEGGVLCDIDAGARDAWEQFLELGDAVVGVVIAAIVLCVICCYVLIIYLQTRGSSRKGDDEAPPPQAQRGATDEMASVSPPVYEMTESSSSSRGGKRAKKREKERARERIASEPPRSARRQKDDDEESSSSDNYNKFERRLDVYESSSESASEHVIVMQTIEVAETPVAMESSGKKSRPTKDIKPAPKKRTKKKKKPAIPNDLDEPAPPPAASSLSSSSDDGDLKWSRVEKVKN